MDGEHLQNIVHVRVSYGYSRRVVVGGGLCVLFPPPLPLMSTTRHSVTFNGRPNAVLVIPPLSFRAYRRRIRLEPRLGGPRNSSFLPFDAEGVWTLWPPLFLRGFGLLSGSGEICQL